MKKTNIAIVLLIVAILSVTVVTAFGSQDNHKAINAQNNLNVEQHQAIHEQMEKIMENGNYQKFTAFKEKQGFDMMPWVKDDATFKQAQERHEQMEKIHEENGFDHNFEGMRGMMHGRGQGNGNEMGSFGFKGHGSFGCDMMDDEN